MGLTACSAAAARDKFMAGVQTLASAASVTYNVNVDILENSTVVQVAGEGQEQDAFVYQNLVSQGFNFEILQTAPEKYYLKNISTRNWLPIDRAGLALSGFSPSYFDQQQAFLKAATNIALTCSEEIDGRQCARYSFVINPENLPDTFLNQVTRIEDLSGVSVTGSLWLEKQSAIPCQSLIEITLGENYHRMVTILYKSLDEPLTFPTP